MMNVSNIKTFPNASSPVQLSANKALRFLLIIQQKFMHEVHLFFQDKVTNPRCERFARSPFVKDCYVPPEGCSKECMDQAANNKCPRQVK